MNQMSLSPLDRVLVEIERALGTVFDPTPTALRPSPSEGVEDAPLTEAERKHAAALMRVNHVGEVCAQALYFGQAAVARDEQVRQHLLQAASEETDHLSWCGERLTELSDRPSLFNPLWYAGAYAIGAGAGLISDRLSLGFVVETERQVEAHLAGHLSRLPVEDARSRAIVTQMKEDEARHAEQALAAGGMTLPPPVPRLMQMAASVMRAIAYRL